MSEDWINNVLSETEVPTGESLTEEHTVESILDLYASNDEIYDEWLEQLDGYELRSHTDELYLGDHTKYLDVKDKPILRKGGMLVRFDEDTGNATLRMGAHIWTVKSESAIFFQKPGKQARMMELLKTMIS